MRRRLTPAALTLAAVASLTGGLLALPAQAADAPRLSIRAIPSWATPTSDIGSLPATQTIEARVYLASRDAAGLDAFVAAVSDPASPTYQQYLTPEEAAARFGALPDAGTKVSAWLTSAGLTVTSSNQHFVAFSGTTTAVSAAFGVSIHNFSVDGKTVYAPVGTVTVPASLTPDVLTVVGLNQQLVVNTPMLISDSEGAAPADTTATGTDAKAFPCSKYEAQKKAKDYPKAYGKTQPFAICGYEPEQLRGAYGVTDTKLTGKGITMVVVDAYALPTMEKDANKWSKNRDEAPFKKGQYKEYVPAGTGYNDGWAGEEALDVEAIHAMAPDAGVAYVAAKTPYDSSFMDAFDTIIDKKLGDAVNNSWEGGTDAQTSPSTIDEFDHQFKMGASEGIGFYFSSGDGGSQGGVVLYPSSDPNVTAVGGSAVGIDKDNSYLWETSWETDYTDLSDDGKSWDPSPPGTFTSGAGGGTSVVFDQPKWQKGVVPAKFSEANGSTPMRTTPDIGADADPTTGFLEGYSSQVGGKWDYNELRIGGTSLSSPLIVGMQAIAEEANGGKAIGFANPAIYKQYDTKAYNDVTDEPFGKDTHIAHVRQRTVGVNVVTSLATAGNAKDTGLASVKGYDTTTGVGTPTADYYKSLMTPLP